MRERGWTVFSSSCYDAAVRREPPLPLFGSVQLFALLGEGTNFKRWLVASLWKNIKNQTQFHAFPMKRWVEFVRIGEDYLRKLR